MIRYILRRLLQAIPLLFIISLILFLLMQNMGDPLATLGGRQRPRPEEKIRLRRQLGLDKPYTVQYLYWLIGNDWTMNDLDNDGVPETPGTRRGVLRGDFGVSLKEKRPVLDVIWDRLPNTLLLMGVYEIVVLIGALLIGVYSALHQYSFLDHAITTLSFIGYSMPIFFVALLAMYLFAVNFKAWNEQVPWLSWLPYLPTVGMFDPKVVGAQAEVPWHVMASQVAWHMVLPVMSLSVISLSGYSRYIRSTMLEVLNQDYIRTARSKGLPRRTVVYVHALKNASLPLVTIIGLDLPSLLAGAVVTERIFSWPGMGLLFLDSVDAVDTPVLMGILMLISVAVVLFQILTDIVYAWLDPRIRYQ